MNKKVLFITVQDIQDKYGNGGVKCSQRNYQLIEEYFGKENTILATFSNRIIEKPTKNQVVFQGTKNVMQMLVAALFGCKIYLPWKEKKILKFIDEEDVDLLFIDSSVLGRLAKHNLYCKTIVFYHNIEADYARNKVKNEGIRYVPSYMASKYNDKVGVQADRVIGLNERDSKRLFQLYGKRMDYLMPMTFTDTFNLNRVKNEYEREVLFVGSFFSANQVSIEWFIKEVMPLLNNIVLNIVGKGFEIMKDTYEQTRNVYVIGSVKELDEYYYRHAAVVLPIICGAGMKVKTVEAMMFGRTIFASNEALEGYEVEGVKGILRCNTAQEYADSINAYFDHKNQYPFEKEVRELFLKKYETEKLKKGFYNMLDCLM